MLWSYIEPLKAWTLNYIQYWNNFLILKIDYTRIYRYYFFLPPDDLYEGRRPPPHLHEPVRTRQDTRRQ